MKKSLLFWLAGLALLRCDPDAGAQDLHPSLARCHALSGVRVVVQPGEVIEGAVVIVRNGVIEAAGTGLPIPADAEVLEGQDLTVTAGFILSGPEVAEPEPASPPAPASRDSEDSWPPPWPLAGVTPGKTAATAAAIELFKGGPWLAQGVTSLLLRPRGRLIPGTGSLISTADGPLSARVQVEQAALTVSAETVAGGYPESLMGSLAILRQAFSDADHLESWRDRYRTDPAGLTPPPHVPELLAIREATRSRPVLLITRRSGDVRRFLDLAREASIQSWVQGGFAVARNAPRIAAAGATAVFDPEPADLKYESNRKRWKDAAAAPGAAAAEARPPDSSGTRSNSASAEAATTAPGEGPPGAGTTAPAVTESISLPDEGGDPYIIDRRRELAAREARDLESVLGGGAVLAGAGVPFFFHLSKPDVLPAAIRAQMASGLDPGLALQALTTRPALLLGIERSHGKVAAGFAGDLVVFRGNVLGGGGIAHVFCRGERYDLGPSKPAPAPAAPPATPAGDTGARAETTLAGVWNLDVEGPGRTEPVTLRVDKRGEGFTGTLASRFGDVTLGSVSLDGREVVITAMATIEEQSVPFRLEGKVGPAGDTLEGTIRYGTSEDRPFKGRKPPEDRR